MPSRLERHSEKARQMADQGTGEPVRMPKIVLLLSFSNNRLSIFGVWPTAGRGLGPSAHTSKYEVIIRVEAGRIDKALFRWQPRDGAGKSK